MRVGADTGGTFTDVVAADGSVAKVPSTPADPGAAVRGGVAAVVAGELVKGALPRSRRSEEHTSELQSLMRISYAVFCLKKKKERSTRRLQLHVQSITPHTTIEQRQ